MGNVNCPFSVKERGTGLLNKCSPGVGKFYCPAFFSCKEVNPILFFNFGDLLA